MSLDQTPTETKILSKPSLEAGSNGCVFWPPPPTEEKNKYEGDKNYLVKFLMFDTPTQKQLQRLKTDKRRQLYTRFAKQSQKEVKIGATLRQIDPTARYLAGIWDSYPTLKLDDPLVQKRCDEIDTFQYFPENFRAFILPFRGTEMRDTLEDYSRTKKPLNWPTTLGPLFLDMAKGLALMHKNGLVHLDLHDGNYLISTGAKTGDFQATLIDFDRVIDINDPEFSQKLQDIAREQIQTLAAIYNIEEERDSFEWNLSRLPPEVVSFSNVQEFDFQGKSPRVLLPQQWQALTDPLISASILDIDHAEEIEQYWKRAYQMAPKFNKNYVYKMDIFALGRIFLVWMAQSLFLIKNMSKSDQNKFFAFVITRMLNPDPTKRPSAQSVVDFLEKLIDRSLNL